MKVAIYARVSTVDQRCETQLDDPSTGLRGYARRQGWDAIEYIDKLSGKEGGKRPELERLLADAKSRKVDVVLCWKMDRFGRSTLDTLENIKTLDLARVRFVCSAMPIDTDDRSPTGRFLLQILAAVAELERAFILERTSMGFKAYQLAITEGKVGDKRGQRRSKSGKNLPIGRPKLVVDRLRIEEMRAAGSSLREIAKKLDVGLGSVHRALKTQRHPK